MTKFACVFVYLLAAPLFAAEIPGLVADKPAEGVAVQTDRGWMVPYTAVIPGSEIKFEMVPIPGGKFLLGSPTSEAKRTDAEGPQFEIEVAPMWVGKHEVAWGEYRHFMRMTTWFKEFKTNNVRPVTDANAADAITSPSNLYDPSFTFTNGDNPKLPAATMSQRAARQYTKWLSRLMGQSYRLPSEAEWEYAARAGTTTAYYFGDDPAQLAEHGWYFENGDEKTHPIGQKKPNPWGLHDIYGNVAEWTLDAYTKDGYKQFDGKSLKASESIKWPNTVFDRTLRGGSWDDDAELCRSAARKPSKDWRNTDPNLPKSPWWFTDIPALGVGFRIVRPLEEPTDADKFAFYDNEIESIQRDEATRLSQGRGAKGTVDAELPAAIKALGK